MTSQELQILKLCVWVGHGGRLMLLVFKVKGSNLRSIQGQM